MRFFYHCYHLLRLFLQVVGQEYVAKGATFEAELQVEFESDCISLQLPSEEDIINGGWRIVPLFHPRVRKCHSPYVGLKQTDC